MKTLVVEDHYITAQLMKEILKSYGKCETAENGEVALDIFKKALMTNEHFNVIFLDIMMPGMNGKEVLEKIRQLEEEYGLSGLDGVKIIMTTAMDDANTILSAFKSQCDGYIVKPISRQIIADKLKELNLI